MTQQEWIAAEKDQREAWAKRILEEVKSTEKSPDEIYREFARDAGITRDAVYKRLCDYPEIQKEIQDCCTKNRKNQIWRNDTAQRVYRLALSGKTKLEICREIGISMTTLRDWQASPEKGIKEALRDGMAEADAKVSESFYESIHERQVTEVTEEFAYEDVDGVTIEKLVKRTRRTRTIPADARAAAKWLAVRQPDKWSESKRIEVTSSTLDYSMSKVEDPAQAASEYSKLIGATFEQEFDDEQD